MTDTKQPDSKRAFLGLGSNLGDSLEFLREAVLGLDATEGPAGEAANQPSPATQSSIDVIAVSSVYETEPIGGPEQGAYLNIVAEIQTTLSPDALLERCLALEQETGRVRRERWGPRTLDVDVLWMDGVEINSESLTIPHPRMKLRRFVMVPLGEIAPEFLEGWQDPQDGEIQKLGSLFEDGRFSVKDAGSNNESFG